MDKLRVAEAISASRPRTVDGTQVKLSDVVVDLDEALIDSIDTALPDILGIRARETIYDRFALELRLAKEDIPEHLVEFREVLKTAFGSGAPLVERFIARRLYATLGWKFLDFAGFGLNEHFEFIRGVIERAKKMNLG